MTIALLVCAISSVVCSIAVVYQSRMIVRLIRENAMMVKAIDSLMIEAVWPPHEKDD